MLPGEAQTRREAPGEPADQVFKPIVFFINPGTPAVARATGQSAMVGRRLRTGDQCRGHDGRVFLAQTLAHRLCGGPAGSRTPVPDPSSRPARWEGSRARFSTGLAGLGRAGEGAVGEPLRRCTTGGQERCAEPISGVPPGMVEVPSVGEKSSDNKDMGFLRKWDVSVVHPAGHTRRIRGVPPNTAGGSRTRIFTRESAADGPRRHERDARTPDGASPWNKNSAPG